MRAATEREQLFCAQRRTFVPSYMWILYGKRGNRGAHQFRLIINRRAGNTREPIRGVLFSCGGRLGLFCGRTIKLFTLLGCYSCAIVYPRSARDPPAACVCDSPSVTMRAFNRPSSLPPFCGRKAHPRVLLQIILFLIFLYNKNNI